MALSNLFGWAQKNGEAAASACGSACGAGDKPEEKPAACRNPAGKTGKLFVPGRVSAGFLKV